MRTSWKSSKNSQQGAAVVRGASSRSVRPGRRRPPTAPAITSTTTIMALQCGAVTPIECGAATPIEHYLDYGPFKHYVPLFFWKLDP